jgi:F0F1-type ATP synthase assembly protein I
MKSDLDDKISGFEQKWLKKAASDTPADTGGQRIAYELLIATIFFGGLGFLIDKQFDTTPTFTLILFFVGFATGVYNAWRRMQGLNEGVGLIKDAPPGVVDKDEDADDRDDK